MADAQAMTIPEQAVKVFMDSFWGAASVFVEPSHVKTALTAAAPYMSGSAREQAMEEAANVVNSDIIKELEDAIAWRKLPGKENHKATLGILERALSAILAFNANLPPRASLDLSNILRHAFISGFEAKGGTITDAINDWPDYNPEKCSAYERIIRALKSQSVPQTGGGK